MKRFFIAFLLLIATGATGSPSEETHESYNNPRQLNDSIVVTANRTATPLAQTASSVTVINAEQIKQSQTDMVVELLRTVPGLDIVQSGGPGKTVSVFVRGAGSNHTLVLIDGVEMNDPATASNNFDFAHLTTNNIERIEILRGPQSTLYGSDAVAGVIQIFTKNGTEKRMLTVQSESGTHSSYQESIGFRGAEKKFNYAMSLSRKDTDGINAVSTTKLNPEKDGYENTDLSGRFNVELSPQVTFSVVGKHINASADIDKNSFPTDDPDYVTNSTFSSFALKGFLSPTGSFMRQEYGISYTKHESESFDYYDADHPDERSDFSTDGERLKLELLNMFEIHNNFDIIAGVETEDEKFSTITNYEYSWGAMGDTLHDLSNRTTGTFLMNRISLMDRWHFTAGIRNDHHERFGNHVTYRLTTVYDHTSLGLKLKGTLGSGFKAPSMFQLYHPTYGDTLLKPEESVGFDIGFEKSFNPHTAFGLTYFHNDFKELIGYDPMTFVNINIGKATTRGVELFFHTRLPHNSALSFSYVYTDTEDKANQRRLIRRPRHSGVMQSSFAVTAKLKTHVNVRYVGERDDTDFNQYPAERVTLDKYIVTDLRMSYTLYGWISLRGRVDKGAI